MAKKRVTSKDGKSTAKNPTGWIAQIEPRPRKKFAAEFALLEKHIAQVAERPSLRFEESPFGRKVANWGELQREKQDFLAHAILEGLSGCRKVSDLIATEAFLDALAWLLRRKIAFTEAHQQPLLQAVEFAPTLEQKLALLSGVLGSFQRIAGTKSLTREARASLNAIHESLRGADPKKHKSAVKFTEQIESLLDDSVVKRLSPDEGWADWLKSWFASLDASEQEQWNAFIRAVGEVRPETKWSVELDLDGEDFDLASLDFSPEAIQSRMRAQLSLLPSSSWTQTIRDHVNRLDKGEVGKLLSHCLHKVSDSRPGMLSRESLNRELLRGLLWLSLELPSPELIQAIQRTTRYCYENKSGLAEAGVAVLCQMATSASASALATLAQVLKSESHQSYVGTALTMLAEKDIHGEALADDSLPTFGFTEFGKLTHEFGDVRAELEIGPRRKVELSWLRDGKPLKSIPAAVRREHGEAIEAIKVTAKGVNEALAGLVSRLEASWLTRTKYRLENWRNQMIEHVLGGTIGRRLIWQFETGERVQTAFWGKRGLIDHRGRAVKVPQEAMVSLWHPLNGSVDDVIAWRERLESEGITQPIKQAHREVYILTDAERATSDHSNRFAAHIIRQAQFRQLAKSRSWKASLIGPWGSNEQVAKRSLAPWGLRAEFQVNPVGDEFETGYKYLSTAQVRFYRNDTQAQSAPSTLESVQALVFSEVMRDVDLFVGVASVGNDPDWANRQGGGEREYWERFSFGELSATAQTRRAVLERLIPRLKIADCCTLAERFLVVRGSLHQYKIHLGSTNILMTPNDQYLCIVPKQSPNEADKVFLPFEGDPTLAVILSKAFLLADDTKITDPTIVSQIKKRR